MNTLRQARQAQGLTLRQLADRSGVSVATIVRVEGGRTRPCASVVWRVSEALGLPPEAVAEFRLLAGALRLPAPALRGR